MTTTNDLEFLNNQKPVKNGLSCPECNKPLYDKSSINMITNMPSKINTICKSCGYNGVRYV